MRSKLGHQADPGRGVHGASAQRQSLSAPHGRSAIGAARSLALAAVVGIQFAVLLFGWSQRGRSLSYRNSVAARHDGSSKERRVLEPPADQP